MDLLACAYRNGSDRMVIVRCEGHDGFYLERVVFPFELLSFECPPLAELEVWTHGLGGPELLDRLPVDQLVMEAPTPPPVLGLINNPFDGDHFGSLQAAAG
jgi:hypothetical protein